MTAAIVLHWPVGLALAPVAGAVWLLVRVLERRRADRLAAALGPRAALLAPGGTARTEVQSRRWFGGCLLLGVLAALQPAWGIDERALERRGVDLVVCLDVSRSMLARDLAPSRLQRARAEVRALAEQLDGDRLGLVVFAGAARLAVPLTADLDTCLGLLELADPASARLGGTDLGAALDTALAALADARAEHAAILLLSDGEDLAGSGLAAAERCRERGIAVHCVGLGSARGSKIAVDGEGGETFLRDSQGREVVTVLDAAGMRRIAAASGGDYVEAGPGEFALLDLHERRIAPMARRAYRAEGDAPPRNRYQWPLAGAVLLALLELAHGGRRKR